MHPNVWQYEKYGKICTTYNTSINLKQKLRWQNLEIMKVTLTTRWIEHKQNTETKELKEGIEIHYYSVNNQNIDEPSEGVIKKDADGLYIEWEDTETKTRLDGSKHTEEVLKNCGWA